MSNDATLPPPHWNWRFIYPNYATATKHASGQGDQHLMNNKDKIDILKRQLRHQTIQGKIFNISGYGCTLASIAEIINSIYHAASQNTAEDSWVAPAYFGMLFIILAQMSFNSATDAYNDAKRTRKKINNLQKRR